LHARLALVTIALLGCNTAGAERDRRSAATAAELAPLAPNEPTVDVVIDSSGIVRMGTAKLLFDDQIVAAFEAFHERAPRGRVVLRANRATLHGRLVRVVDLAKQAHASFEIVVED
jgi:biopolymer transport protein ExbD